MAEYLADDKEEQQGACAQATKIYRTFGIGCQGLIDRRNSKSAL